MSDVAALLAAFDSGALLRPAPDRPNLVAFARALNALAGAPQRLHDPVADELATTIGEHDHLVFAIVDGFGMNFVRRLGDDAFVRRHLHGTLQSVFPSSTGPALFAVSSCSWPGTHGFLGWHVYVPEIGATTTPYLWLRSGDRTSLADLGVEPHDVFLGRRAFDDVQLDFRVYLPAQYIGSPASVCSFAPEKTRGATSFGDAIDQTIRRIAAATARTVTYLYWPSLDSTAHDLGESHPDTLVEAARLDAELARLHDGLPSNARLVMTADHGHTDVPHALRIRVDPDEPLGRTLHGPPSGEPRVPLFRVKDHERFPGAFRERLGEHYFLLTIDEADDLRLFGPDGISPRVRERVGDAVGIARGDASLEVCTAGKERWLGLNSIHGGMTPDDVLVPLVLA